MATGSGEGTPIPVTPSSSISPFRPTQQLYNQAVTLTDYAYIIQYDEPAFWGVYYEGQPTFACSNFWSEGERVSIARALAQAQQMMEDYLGFFLAPTWVVGKEEDAVLPNANRFIDENRYIRPFRTRYSRLQKFGVRAESVIESNASISYITEPAVVGPITTTITSTEEVKIFLPGTDREIQPSSMTYSGGDLTIYIPRSRLLKEELLWQTGDGQEQIRFEDIDNFVTTVDVKRIYNDPSTNVKLVEFHRCNAFCLAAGCTEFVDNGCAKMLDPSNGIVDIQPASFSDNAWTVSHTFCSKNFTWVRLYYKCGLNSVDVHMQEAIVRLAHTLMPANPCRGCAHTQQLWERDRDIPSFISPVRQGNPFGEMTGALWAYKQVQRLRTNLKISVL